MSLGEIKTKTEESLTDIYAALGEKGADVSEQKNLVNVASGIRSITGGDSNSGKYVWAKYSDYVEEKIPENATILTHFDDNLNNEISNSTFSMSSGNTNYSEGVFDKAISLNGSQCLMLPYSSNTYNFTNEDWTIAGLFKIPTINVGENWLISTRHRYNSTYTYAGWSLMIVKSNDGSLSLQCQMSTTYADRTWINATVSITNNTWFHVALVKKGTMIYIFLNGKKVAGQNVGQNIYTGGGYLRVCGDNGGQTSTSTTVGYLKADVDEFIIVKGTALWTEDFILPTLAYGENTGTFEGYVISDNENAYPNDEYAEDGYYYKSEIIDEKYEGEQIENYLMLYDGTLGEAGENGANVCSAFTGGYTPNFDIDPNYGVGSVTFNANDVSVYARKSSTHNTATNLWSNNPIDMSGFSKIALFETLNFVSPKQYSWGDTRLTQNRSRTNMGENYGFASPYSSNYQNGVKVLYEYDLSNTTVKNLYLYFNVSALYNTTISTEIKVHNAFLVKTDNYQQILDLAGITTVYTDEASICADSTTMATILNNEEAVKYMIYNCTGTFMLAFIQSETALSTLNKSDYRGLVYGNDVWFKFLSMIA